MFFFLVLLYICMCFWQNYPLYIRSVPTQNELKFHYTVHTSLDVVEEKISAVGKALGDQRELYLGLLYPTEDYKVYPLLLSNFTVCFGGSYPCTYITFLSLRIET